VTAFNVLSRDTLPKIKTGNGPEQADPGESLRLIEIIICLHPAAMQGFLGHRWITVDRLVFIKPACGRRICQIHVSHAKRRSAPFMSMTTPESRQQGHEGLSFANLMRDCFVWGVLMVNHRKQIASCTPEAERLLRLRPGQTVNASLSVVPAPLQEIIREVISTNKPLTDRSLVLPQTGREPVVLHVCATPVSSQAGQIEVVVVLNDLTPAQRLEQNMRRLDRLASIGTLSTSMAHEIKNALVAVKTFVGLLLEKSRDDELAQTVGREMSRIDAIVSQMLRFGGPARPVHSPVRVHDVLNHALRMVQHQIDGTLVCLSRRFNASPDAVTGDDYQLEQAFVNLLLNALEAMGSNGTLTVATENVPAEPDAGAPAELRGAHRIRVSVQDTGVGISTENMARLFEPFFTTKQTGTGLGLPICQRIIQEHHGAISVQSEPNKGTTFTVLLPASGQTS
jgi:two-component system sensor histidine kinase HydH